MERRKTIYLAQEFFDRDRDDFGVGDVRVCIGESEPHYLAVEEGSQ